MTADKFLEMCERGGLKLAVDYDEYTISITGEAELAAQAQSELDKSREFTARVLVALTETDAILRDLLTERAAIRAADYLPGDLYSAALVSIRPGRDESAKPDVISIGTTQRRVACRGSIIDAA